MTLQERLRQGAVNGGYPTIVPLLTQAADKIDTLESKSKNLRTTMMAAAVEIAEHWDDHCDAEGYGPINLLRRLEGGYPAEYGYDAQTVVRLESRIDALEAEVESLQLRNQELAADKEVLLGHMVTIRNCANDPAISNLANVVLERMAPGGMK